jgi:hypothetical protein
MGSNFDKGRIYVRTQRILQRSNVHFKLSQETKLIITVSPTLYYLYLNNFNPPLNLGTVDSTTYVCLLRPIFLAVYSTEILVSAASRWRDNSAETCRRRVKDCTHKL